MKKLRKEYTPGAYNKCITCPYQGSGCDGPRTSSLPIARWCELMRSIKDYKGFTNDYIAEKAMVSPTTIDRIMALKIDTDIKFSTFAAIEGVMFGTSGTYPCPLELMGTQAEMHERISSLKKEVEEKNEQVARLRKTIDEIHVSYKEEMDVIRNEAQRKIDHLLKEAGLKDRIIEKLLK